MEALGGAEAVRWVKELEVFRWISSKYIACMYEILKDKNKTEKLFLG